MTEEEGEEENWDIPRGTNNNGSPTLDVGFEGYQEEVSLPRSSRNKALNFFKCWRRSSSHEEETENETEVNKVISFLAKIYSRRPLIVLLSSLVVAFTITWITLSEYGLPEFDDPYLGFETRSTEISDRLVTLRNLKNEVNQLSLLENYPGEKLSGREWLRKKRDGGVEGDTFEFNSRDMCTNNPMEEFSRVALELETPSDIFDYETVMLICFFQKKLEEMPEYRILCEKDGVYECCPGWSLPNYIAAYANKTDCAQLQKFNVRFFESDMKYCRNFYKNESNGSENACWKREGGICPNFCWHGGIIHSAYSLTLDNRFITKNESRFTMLILPVAKSSNDHPVMEEFQEELPLISLPKNYVSLAGYDFGGKDNTFKSYLVSDLQFMVIASVIIFFVVCFYTKSIFVTIISFTALTLSLGNAYFIYMAVLKVPYFPFMNMLVTIIVMGIGTDGTLILGSQWDRLKAKHLSQVNDKLYWETLMAKLLNETTSPLIITTCTTAAAFFASLTSSITTIRCFSIFAGTSTLVGFLLLYLTVPPALILSDLTCNYLKSLLPIESEEKLTFYSKFVQFLRRLSDLRRACVHVFIKPYHYLSKTLIKNHRAKCWLSMFLLLTSVLMWSIFVVFIHPKFQLPNTEQFQLLSSNHPIERFDRIVEPEFTIAGRSEEELGDKMTVYYVWGVESTDTGNKFDPMDNGELKFDNRFSLGPPQNQKWMRKLCQKLKTQGFYDEVANSMVGAHYDGCFIETMTKWMKRDCEHIFFKNISYAPCCKLNRFPYEAPVFDKCVGLASRDMHRTPSLYFRSDVAGPKFFVKSGNNASTSDKEGSLATFTLRVKTNITFSLTFEKMDKFYKELDTFYEQYLKSDAAPEGLQNGFFVSAHLDFYDLQMSLLSDTVQSVLLSAGLCFLLLWIFVRELRVAIGAVICIFAIVLVSSAILITAFSWKLGVFESIAVTVAIGLSDFTAHNSIEFAKRKSVAQMTSPTFFAAVTTITMGLMMLIFSNVLVYQQIGAFFFILIVVSWTYSVFFLSPVLATFDYLLVAFEQKRMPKPKIFTIPQNNIQINLSQIDEDTVYSNVMVKRRRKDGKFRGKRARSEPSMQNARNSVHFDKPESPDCFQSEMRILRGSRSRSKSSQNMMEQWKLLKKLGTETAV